MNPLMLRTSFILCSRFFYLMFKLHTNVQVKGERLYSKARRGEEIDVPARPVTIYDFQLKQNPENRSIHLHSVLWYGHLLDIVIRFLEALSIIYDYRCDTFKRSLCIEQFLCLVLNMSCVTCSDKTGIFSSYVQREHIFDLFVLILQKLWRGAVLSTQFIFEPQVL